MGFYLVEDIGENVHNSPVLLITEWGKDNEFISNLSFFCLYVVEDLEYFLFHLFNL